jgi:hypothetical protein
MDGKKGRPKMKTSIQRIGLILSILLAAIYITNGQVSAKESTSFVKTKINEIAHIKSKVDKIYKSPDDKNKFKLANTTYTGRAYYAKSKTKIGKTTYYQLYQGSKEIGWVASGDLKRNKRTLLNTKKSTAYISGSGTAYDIPWGGTKNKKYTLSNYRAKNISNSPYRKNRDSNLVSRNTKWQKSLDFSNKYRNKSIYRTEPSKNI